MLAEVRYHFMDGRGKKSFCTLRRDLSSVAFDGAISAAYAALNALSDANLYAIEVRVTVKADYVPPLAGRYVTAGRASYYDCAEAGGMLIHMPAAPIDADTFVVDSAILAGGWCDANGHALVNLAGTKNYVL